MAVGAGVLASIAASTFDFYYQKGTLFESSIQGKPLLKKMDVTDRDKTFPGGKGNISISVKNAYGNPDTPGTNDKLVGFSYDDTVVYYTPGNVKKADFPWREHHIGITCTYTELKNDGISVTDDSDPANSTSQHSKRELTRIVDIFKNYIADMAEQYARQMNSLLWGDGTTDAKALAGIRAHIVDDPSVGTIGGFNRATAGNEWIRNYAYTAAFGAKVTGTPALAAWGGGPVTSDVADGGALAGKLQTVFRLLSRYGGNPNTVFAGADFIDALEKEIRANGSYSVNGFRGRQDAAMGDLYFDGVVIQHDWTLDQMGFGKRCYIWDDSTLFLMKMEQEWNKPHSPPRPPSQYVLYKSITSTGQVVSTQLNNAAVIDIS
jgi:hypothetical protein